MGWPRRRRDDGACIDYRQFPGRTHKSEMDTRSGRWSVAHPDHLKNRSPIDPKADKTQKSAICYASYRADGTSTLFHVHHTE